MNVGVGSGRRKTHRLWLMEFVGFAHRNEFPRRRPAADGRQVLVTVHHEPLLDLAIDGQVVVGRVRFVGVILVIVLECRVDRHLTTDDHLGIRERFSGRPAVDDAQ